MRIANPITGVTQQKGIKVEPKLAILMLKKSSAFVGESITVRIQTADNAEQKYIVNLMQVKYLLPHVGIFNQSGVINNSDGSQVALIPLADGNIPTNEDYKLFVDLTDLDTTKTYTLNALATETVATTLFDYRYGNLDIGQPQKNVGLLTAQSIAFEKTFTDLVFTSKAKQNQELDAEECQILELFNGNVGNVTYDADVLGFVKTLDNFFTVKVGNQEAVLIKVSGAGAAVGYSTMGVQRLY